MGPTTGSFAGDGSFLELLAVADPLAASASADGPALAGRIGLGDGLLGWAVAVEDRRPVAARLGTSISTVGRQGMIARLTGLAEALAEPCLPFFIERRARRPARGGGARQVASAGSKSRATPARLEHWLGGAELPVRALDGDPRLRAIGIGDRQLRTG